MPASVGLGYEWQRVALAVIVLKLVALETAGIDLSNTLAVLQQASGFDAKEHGLRLTS